MVRYFIRRFTEEVERKVAEAYYIFGLKPTINGKEEMEGLDLLIDRRDPC